MLFRYFTIILLFTFNCLALSTNPDPYVFIRINCESSDPTFLNNIKKTILTKVSGSSEAHFVFMEKDQPIKIVDKESSLILDINIFKDQDFTLDISLTESETNTKLTHLKKDKIPENRLLTILGKGILMALAQIKTE